MTYRWEEHPEASILYDDEQGIIIIGHQNLIKGLSYLVDATRFGDGSGGQVEYAGFPAAREAALALQRATPLPAP